MQLVNSETRSTLTQRHPEALAELDRLADTLDASSLDPALLDLCQSYFATSLSGATWSPERELTELESDCIKVCEQFMVSVASMTDEQMALLSRHLGADDVYNLMYAIYVLEMSERLGLVLKGVLQ
ncbi:MAG: hypothetical protein QNJ19_08880 [Woeseiaceae bacterium]|nr:hypothetical protein [Woeseiaceae bacterium]